MKTQSLRFSASLLFLFMSHTSAAATGDSCLNMMNSHFEGTYVWAYRGDRYEVPMQSDVEYGNPHKYVMHVTLQATQHASSSTFTLSGNCMNSQIYFEDTSMQSPIYLQGTIDSDVIELTGQRGPNQVVISLKKQVS